MKFILKCLFLYYNSARTSIVANAVSHTAKCSVYWQFAVFRIYLLSFKNKTLCQICSFDDGDFDDAEEDEGLDDLENAEDVSWWFS